MEDILASIRRIIDEDDRKAAPAQAPQPVAAEEDDDVLDLTETADEPASTAPEQPAAEGEETDAEGPEGPVEEDIGAEIWASDDEVSPVSEEVAEPLEMAEPEAHETPYQEAQPVSGPDTVSQESTMTSSNRDRLVSDAAMSSAAAALGNLARASERDPLSGVPQGRPVEELVMELLRPMLREWLDEHLPAVVERIVEREVRYLSRRLGGDDGA